MAATPATPTAVLRTGRLVLTPLRVADAADMLPVLADPALYEFTGGEPPVPEALEARYRAQVAGPGDPDHAWHNWVIRLADSGVAVGYVQATVTGDRARVAWVVGVGWQGRGIATEAARAMCAWLTGNGVSRVDASIHPRHAASQRVAAAIGLAPTGCVDSDGEVLWTSSVH